MKMIGAAISALVGVVVVAAADQVAPRMDRSKTSMSGNWAQACS